MNSIRARLPRVLEFLQERSPDVLLLQETKCSADQFPREELARSGYSAVDHSGGRWCGVAILVPEGVEAADPSIGLPGEPDPEEARWIEATIAGIRFVSVYAPNGREVDSEHYRSKIDFFSRASERAAALAATGPLVIAGDMNVAPTDDDVWDPAHFEGLTHVTTAEREALSRVLEAGGLSDAWDCTDDRGDVRFTWWDYRGGGLHRDLGMRIDHFLIGESVAERLASLRVERDFRKGHKPSDHAPLSILIAD